MECSYRAEALIKKLDEVVALDHVTLSIQKPRLVGLLGKNGSGKTTLLRHVVGFYRPTAGTSETLGLPSDRLGSRELARIGFVPQDIRLLDWMTVEQHIRYVSTFYERWDREREARLREELELDGDAHVGALSAGNAQKLAVLLAVCHHPELLVLDEPVSDLDPIARGKLLQFLLDVLSDDGAAIIIASHVLRDVEHVVDWIVCLHEGHVTTDASLDDLKERYAEWRISTRNGTLPQRFSEPFVLEQEVGEKMARVVVRSTAARAEAFQRTYNVDLASRPLNLEQMFPLLLSEDES